MNSSDSIKPLISDIASFAVPSASVFALPLSSIVVLNQRNLYVSVGVKPFVAVVTVVFGEAMLLFVSYSLTLCCG